MGLGPFSNESKLGLCDRPAVQVTRRAIRFWIRRYLETKNANAHNASRRTMTMTAMNPPETPCDFFVPLPELVKTESGGDVIDEEGAGVLPKTGP